MKHFFFFLTVLSLQGFSQDTVAKKNSFTLSGYAEVYYSYDFQKPANHIRQSFFYNYSRHNEVNLNLGLIRASYLTDRIRGNVALMAGTYPQYNLSHEGQGLRNIYEANAGVKISAKKNLWFDAGIMPSHIGFESAFGKDCWNLTRSVVADNSPYYEAGAKLGYTTDNQKVYVAVMYLNGWQRIQRIDGNNTPAIGTQLTLTPDKNFKFNWSTYAGSEFPDTERRLRVYNNFFAQYQFTEKFAMIVGFDYGMQEIKKGGNNFARWMSPLVVAQYKPKPKLAIGARIEHFRDPSGVLISWNGNVSGMEGYSLNIDYLPVPNVILRVEGRALSGLMNGATTNIVFRDNNEFITAAICLTL